MKADEYRKMLGLPPAGYENPPHRRIQSSKPKRDKAQALDKTIPGETAGVQRVKVRFIGYRCRPLDPDNFAGGTKDLLDGIRHAGLIHDDSPEAITLETEQIKVRHYSEERTEIEITYP